MLSDERARGASSNLSALQQLPLSAKKKRQSVVIFDCFCGYRRLRRLLDVVYVCPNCYAQRPRGTESKAILFRRGRSPRVIYAVASMVSSGRLGVKRMVAPSSQVFKTARVRKTPRGASAVMRYTECSIGASAALAAIDLRRPIAK